MDRSNEPPATFADYKTVARLAEPVGAPRIWKLPVPVRVKHSGFKNAGITAPCPCGNTGILTLRVHGFPTLLTFPGDRTWLVTTVAPPEGRTPTDPFAAETLPFRRIDGEPCKGFLTASSKGLVYMANIDLTRASLGSMVDRTLTQDPASRILVRLLPRYTCGSLRWFPTLNCYQFWSAL